MTAVKQAIGDALRGDATYLTLMGNPSGAEKETFYLQPTGPLRFPRTVFAMSRVVNDTEMPPELMQSRPTVRVVVWAKDNSHESIMDRIVHILHGGSFGYHCIQTDRPQEIYNQDIDAYGLVANFDVFYRRARP